MTYIDCLCNGNLPDRLASGSGMCLEWQQPQLNQLKRPIADIRDSKPGEGVLS
jgi:hypothetical protein